MRVVFIGAGNVATHLALAMSRSGFDIVQVFSRTQASACALAQQVDADYTTELSSFCRDADVYIYSVSDDALPGLISKVNIPEALHIHTSGSTAMNLFEQYASNYGVLYPLQTFSKSKDIDFSEVSFFVEGNSSDTENRIIHIARQLSDKVYVISSEDRLNLHVSAVFACNFVNHMYEVASELVEGSGIPFDVLLPLIEETLDKVKVISPYEAQTGPAVRNDIKIQEKHIEILRSKRELAAIYQMISRDILMVHTK